ncbi:hypothetical protein WJX72_004723 [[Myrmecia] bisecta]|uniref:Uncharacterized protein n=1 Tax=[Myrmecia] bisecta TaxID=41462 RepID=A0AAW1PEH2_9CHLO
MQGGRFTLLSGPIPWIMLEYDEGLIARSGADPEQLLQSFLDHGYKIGVGGFHHPGVSLQVRDIPAEEECAAGECVLFMTLEGSPYALSGWAR